MNMFNITIKGLDVTFDHSEIEVDIDALYEERKHRFPVELQDDEEFKRKYYRTFWGV